MPSPKKGMGDPALFIVGYATNNLPKKYMIHQSEEITIRPCLANAKTVIVNESGALRTNNKCVTRIGQLSTKLGRYPKKYNIMGNYPSIFLKLEWFNG
jgi:hypothetical protein